ncbi:MAG: tyrosine-type recombinase/integrase [Saprospiraceae bacterium]|jgi:integrase/recombinase XerD|nr:tyrosine-type recombinase/integrase [Saprospiraceae bacterium]MBL0261322.1 tyrosine-type recombinase/integrase [Saprospiraceae bacterium]
MKLENYISQHYSTKSVKRYTRQIEQFKEVLGNNADQSNYQDILNYIGTLRERKLHPKSLRNHLHSLKIYFRYLVEIKIRKDHPCENLQLKDQINKSILVESLYSKEELEMFYQEFTKRNENTIENTKNKIILGLLIYQALTSSEIIELKVSDINLEEGTIKIKGNDQKTKSGNKGRILALKPKQILLIHEYLKTYRKELWKRQKPSKRTDYFLLNERGLQLYGSYMNRMLDKLTNKKYSPLKIRQSVIANLLKENHDLRVVQEFAGHRKTGSTEAYKRTGFEELRVSIERLHPLQ